MNKKVLDSIYNFETHTSYKLLFKVLLLTLFGKIASLDTLPTSHQVFYYLVLSDTVGGSWIWPRYRSNHSAFAALVPESLNMTYKG